jgi:hypothetical protein
MRRACFVSPPFPSTFPGRRSSCPENVPCGCPVWIFASTSPAPASRTRALHRGDWLEATGRPPPPCRHCVGGGGRSKCVHSVGIRADAARGPDPPIHIVPHPCITPRSCQPIPFPLLALPALLLLAHIYASHASSAGAVLLFSPVARRTTACTPRRAGLEASCLRTIVSRAAPVRVYAPTKPPTSASAPPLQQ